MEINRSNYFEVSNGIFNQVTDTKLTRLLIENGMDEKDFEFNGQRFEFDFHSYSARYDARSIYFVSVIDGKTMLYRVSDHWSCEETKNGSKTQTNTCGHIRRCFWVLNVTESSNRNTIAGVSSFDEMTLHSANGDFCNSFNATLSCA